VKKQKSYFFRTRNSTSFNLWGDCLGCIELERILGTGSPIGHKQHFFQVYSPKRPATAGRNGNQKLLEISFGQLSLAVYFPNLLKIHTHNQGPGSAYPKKGDGVARENQLSKKGPKTAGCLCAKSGKKDDFFHQFS